jgi:1-acyl-sn-glycerol-3-phosphate acyltransferase
MWQVLKRRSISISLYFFLFIIYTLFLPISLVLSIISDLVIKKHFSITRGVLFLFIYLSSEIVGIFSAFFIWLFYAKNKELFRQKNFILQSKWTSFLAHASFKLFEIKLELEGQEEIGTRPIIVFMRHTSVADTIIPAVFISVPNNIILRYVLKKELLFDPCLDIVGNRLKNYFVNRKPENTAEEVKKVGLLAKDLKNGEGVLIYPEGTRFSQSKYNKIIEKLKQNNDLEMLERALVLKNVLPPRLGGTLELLNNNKNADIIFCTHTGLEGSASFSKFINGKLIKQTLKIKFWKIPFENVPSEKEQQILWLYENWQKVDTFVSN